jgi:uncharacterized membrane protein YhaH (DUF805 family)
MPQLADVLRHLLRAQTAALNHARDNFAVLIMPIRVTCQCGASLSVPDAMAGKNGKCPKCGAAIKIPQSSPTASSAKSSPAVEQKNTVAKASPKSASPTPSTSIAPGASPKSKTPEKAIAAGALDQLFSDAGLDKQPAQTCPGCKVEITPGAAICVACGLNLTTGEMLKGFKVVGEEEDQAPKFNNYQLNRAAKSIKKEEAEELELRFVGAPWWVSLAIVLGIITIIIFGVIYVDGMGSGEEGASFKASAKSFEGRVQRQPPLTLLVVVCFLVSSMVVMMATIAIQVQAFKRSWKTGLLTLIPGYVQYYSIVARKRLRSTTKILWIWTIIFVVFSVFLVSMRAYRVFTG